MTIVPIALPVVGGPGRIGGEVFWETTCVPSLESDPGDDGFGCTAALFGYLSDIWTSTVWPTRRTVDEPFELIGSGEYISPPGAFPNLAQVICSFDKPPPEYTDLLFGTVPLYYLGMVGFGTADVTTVPFNAGPLVLRGGIVKAPVAKTEPIYVNHLFQAFLPKDRILNSFWWHLKPGVRGMAFPRVIDPGFGASANPGGAAQSWGPSAGGWCQIPPSPFGQVFDGCGNVACGGNSSGG